MLPSLILTYHAIEPGPAPLCLEPELFASHLDLLVSSGARAVGVSELGAAIRAGGPQERTVAITFDDGFASVTTTAAPMLLDRGLRATVYCVAGHLGGTNDWPSAHAGGYSSPLATAEELRSIAGRGLEIGSHGTTHAPLTSEDRELLEREIVDSRSALETALDAPVESFAYPYGAGPSSVARRLVSQTYTTACTTRLAPLDGPADVHALPRIDAHYLRSPSLLRRALDGSLGPYLLARRLGARARRAIRTDYARVA
jgi:peptidoglycan/xylan/chitin deacetylase (PgdA/CDA1 family)